MSWLQEFLCLVIILFSIGVMAGLARYAKNGRWVSYLFWAAIIVIALFVAIFIKSF